MEQIKKFTEEFFRNLKCDISQENRCLIIKNAPKTFEDIFGKPAPYYLVFTNPKGEEELVEKEAGYY